MRNVVRRSWHTPRRATVLTAAALTFTALTGCGRDPVDPDLVGSWQTAVTSPTGAWTMHFTTLSNGQYRTDFIGPFAVPPETGYFEADDGEWHLEKLAGGTDEGTYQFLNADTVLFQSASGAVLWNRMSAAAGVGSAGPASAANGAGVAPADAPTPAPANGGFGALGGSPPSAAGGDESTAAAGASVMSAGPFGAPLSGPAALSANLATNASGTAPQLPFGAAPSLAAPLSQGVALPGAGTASGAPSGFMNPFNAPAPLGVPKQTPSSVFAAASPTSGAARVAGGSFFAPNAARSSGSAGFGPQTVDSAITGVDRQLDSSARSLTDIPDQAIGDIQRSTDAAAAGIVNDVTAPVTDAADEATRRVGQRVQIFTGNASAKIRNFFSRSKKDDESERSDDR